MMSKFDTALLKGGYAGKLEERQKAELAIRKVLRAGILTTIYGIILTYLVKDFEVLLLGGCLVLLIDVVVFWGIIYRRKRCQDMENESNES